MIMPAGEPGFAAVPIRDRGEVLVNVAASSPLLVADHHTVPARYPSPTFLRTGVVDRLVVAQSLLPRDFLLMVVAGYWPTIVASGAIAAADAHLVVDGEALPELTSHPTGGAVDLTLCGPTGTPLPVDRRLDVPGCLTCDSRLAGVDHDLPGQPEAEHRDLLTTALSTMGFVNNPARWWHWSYGDQYWAFRTAAPHARYGAVAPTKRRRPNS